MCHRLLTGGTLELALLLQHNLCHNLPCYLLPSISNMANVSHTADRWDTRTSTAAFPGHQDTLPCKETGLDTLVGGPARPVLHNYPQTNFGKQNRAFSVTQYDSYNFIEYSISSDGVFCFPCRHFMPSSTQNSKVFIYLVLFTYLAVN